ncbi:tRNA isopentenyltransferase [Cristinia sonorae]|uniref:tRNA isopentenyltransferase n=1 Tax=Cristinia sonorae TaxID=1940300 RepID=A0A8K0XX42_9AGAR|nr:tRNA isopentenyltransferase [Cristinia sonorae]
MTLRPILAICGTTGVGKSKLAIELALAISNASKNNPSYPWQGARVINADAMQVYAGMDILTNKVTEEEQCGVEHLLMGFKKPGEQYVVGQWVKDAISAIDESHQQRKLPIVVGGTSYWIQHLVFPGRLVSSPEETNSDLRKGAPSAPLAIALEATPPNLLDTYNNLPDEPPSADTHPEEAYSLHSLLSSLDPIVASRWHWKDTRKVLRSLQIIKQTGRLSSDIIREQAKTVPEPRYRTLFLWLYAKPEVLHPRLDVRVDEMMQRGLLQEVKELTELANDSISISQEHTGESTQETDYTLGIYQSIGYREFSQYLSSPHTPMREKTYANAIERMKISTRKYAKKQVRWIRNSLLPMVNAVNGTEVERQIVPAYLLDATELGDSWNTNVRQVAEQITQDFLSERPLLAPLSLSEAAREMLSIPEKATNPEAKLEARRKAICPICTLDETQPVMIEEGREWQAHIGTRVHKRLAQKAKGSPDEQQRDRRRGNPDQGDANVDFNLSSLGNEQ